MNRARNSTSIYPLTFGLCAAMVLLFFALPAHARYGGGTGTLWDPYKIATAGHLIDIGNHEEDWDKRFILVNDIDLDPNLPGRKVFDKTVIAPQASALTGGFTGVFDGNHHKIWNFTLVYPTAPIQYVGLFGYVGFRGPALGIIKNLGLENVDVHPLLDVDAPWGSFVGALAGHNGGTISNCYASGRVAGVTYVGGLVGRHQGAGRSQDFVIESCYFEGTVWGHDRIGGLVGINGGSILKNCYSTANVSGVSEIGGLVGENSSCTTTNCYSTGRVDGQVHVGGLVGYGHVISLDPSHVLIVTASFWDTKASGQTTSSGGEGKTTAEMQTKSTFTNAGWDFVDETANGTEDLWKMPALKSYPLLSWQEAKVAPEDLLNQALALIQGFAPATFSNPGSRNDLTGKLQAVIALVRAGLYRDALNDLRNEVLPRIDGCAETGQPDGTDWIITCEAQQKVYPLVLEAIKAIKPLVRRVYTLTISSTPGGSVPKPGEGTFICNEGESVPIEAVAKAGYEFKHWSGTAVDAGKVAKPEVRSSIVVVDADYTLTANFLASPPSPPSSRIEGFEQGNFGTGWSSAGPLLWSVTSEDKHSGKYSARAGAIGNKEATSLTLQAKVAEGRISFWRKISSEKGCDVYRFWIDGQPQEALSGQYDWKEVSFPVAAGSHTFVWEYRKDIADSAGADTVYLDDVSIPPAP